MAVPLCPPGLAKQTFPQGRQLLVLLPGLLPKLSLCSCQRLPLNFTAIPGLSLSTQIRTCLHPPVTPVLSLSSFVPPVPRTGRSQLPGIPIPPLCIQGFPNWRLHPNPQCLQGLLLHGAVSAFSGQIRFQQ